MARDLKVAVSRNTATVRARSARAVESFGCAAEAIGPVEAGMSLFAITRGQWSMIDAILHVLDCVGEARISLWTWTVAEYEIQVLTRLRRDKRLKAGLLVIDHGARNKNAGLIREWKETFGPESVRYVLNHAKIATVEGGGLRLALRGSLNLNYNPRFEQFDITEGGPDFDLIRQIEDELPVLEDTAPGPACFVASKVGKAFDMEQLNIFSGIKRWAK